VDHRLEELKTWINQSTSLSAESIIPASADASFRRYFRLSHENNTYIVMDAPPDKESVSQFIKLSEVLSSIHVHAPEVIEKNSDQGFLLLEDLGDRPFLNELERDAENLYASAIDALIRIQQGNKLKPDVVLPSYDRDKLLQEMNLFPTWYLKKHHQQSMTEEEENIWDQTTELLIEACLEQPQVWVHRDYHSRNLMITDSNSPGVIDFQDMVVGPICYDLVSLYKDCYIEWPREKQIDWLQHYLSKLSKGDPELKISFDQLLKWYDLTGLQRHLKVLGIFCRLNYRDTKPQYLADLPLVEKYVHEVLNIYPELSDFKAFFDRIALVR